MKLTHSCTGYAKPYTWNYRGKKKPADGAAVFTNCPRCHSLVRIREQFAPSIAEKLLGGKRRL